MIQFLQTPIFRLGLFELEVYGLNVICLILYCLLFYPYLFHQKLYFLFELINFLIFPALLFFELFDLLLQLTSMFVYFFLLRFLLLLVLPNYLLVTSFKILLFSHSLRYLGLTQIFKLFLSPLHFWKQLITLKLEFLLSLYLFGFILSLIFLDYLFVCIFGLSHEDCFLLLQLFLFDLKLFLVSCLQSCLFFSQSEF